MARDISVQQINNDGLAASYDLLDEDLSFPNGKNVFLHVKKGTEATDITIQTNFSVDGIDLPDKTITAVSDEFIGPFSEKVFENNEGKITIQSTEIDAEVAALRI